MAQKTFYPKIRKLKKPHWVISIFPAGVISIFYISPVEHASELFERRKTHEVL